MTVRLLTNIGRLWTGSEILSNAAIVTGDDRIAWVGPAAELPQRIPGVVDRMILAAAEASGEILWALDGPLVRLARSLGIATRKHS